MLEARARPAAVAVELQSGLETREVRPSGAVAWTVRDSDVFPSPVPPKLQILLTGCLPCPDSMHKTRLLPFKLCSSARIPLLKKQVALPFPAFLQLKADSAPWRALCSPFLCGPSAPPSLS